MIPPMPPAAPLTPSATAVMITASRAPNTVPSTLSHRGERMSRAATTATQNRVRLSFFGAAPGYWGGFA